MKAKLHARYIDAIQITGSHILTGGRDSKINILTTGYDLLFTIDTSLFKNSINGEVRAMSLNAASDKIMIGTFGHEVIEIPVDLAHKSHGEATVLVHGHYAPVNFLTNEAWGLCIFPKQLKYATVSDDATLRVWDTVSKKQISMLRLDIELSGARIPPNKDNSISLSAQARCVDINSTEEYLAMGMRDGAVRVYNTAATAQGWTMISSYLCKHKKIPAEWIEDLKFSPDSQYLIVTSHNNFMYLFATPNFDTPVKQFGNSSSFITHVDWSLDS